MSQKLNQDFQAFLSDSEQQVPKRLDKMVMEFIDKELNPSHGRVLVKLFAIQSFIGFLTLLFCPQFDLSLTNHYELFHFFHRHFGEYICYAVCGCLFVGSGALFALLILKNTELQIISQAPVLYYTGYSGIAILTFLFFGADIYFSALFIWSLGGISAGVLSIKLNRLLVLSYR